MTMSASICSSHLCPFPVTQDPNPRAHRPFTTLPFDSACEHASHKSHGGSSPRETSTATLALIKQGAPRKHYPQSSAPKPSRSELVPLVPRRPKSRPPSPAISRNGLYARAPSPPHAIAPAGIPEEAAAAPAMATRARLFLPSSKSARDRGEQTCSASRWSLSRTRNTPHTPPRPPDRHSLIYRLGPL